MDNKEQQKKFSVRCRAIILHNDKLFVVSHTPEKTFYALPGGHLEWGENIKECLKREIVEELGVDPKLGRLLYIHNCLDGLGKQSIEFFFEITNGDDYVDLTKLSGTHTYELSDLRWVSKGDNIQFKPKQVFEDFKNGEILSDKVRFIEK